MTEVMTPEDIDFMLPHADILQVGSRNMQNFSLLKALGKVDKPVLLKRGMMATIDEWLQAAEYIMAGGNFNVILVRAWNKELRKKDPQHPGSKRRTPGQEFEPPPHNRRPQPRDGKERARPQHEPCGFGSRCRRLNRRGASESQRSGKRRGSIA